MECKQFLEMFEYYHFLRINATLFTEVIPGIPAHLVPSSNLWCASFS